MSRLFQFCVCMALVSGLYVLPTQADEKPKKVDNPTYKHWAQFKPGAYATMKATTTAMGIKSEMTMTTTLKKVTAEKVVIEITAVTKSMGQEMKLPPQAQDIPAKIEEVKAKELQNPKGKVKEGTETLTVCGKKIETKWVEIKATEKELTIISKIWTSDEVPGQVVKMSSKTEGQIKSTTDSQVSKFDAKKKSTKKGKKSEKKPDKKKDGKKDKK